MRIVLFFLVLAVAVQLHAAEAKKFRYIGGFNDVQIMRVDHRGIQVMHAEGIGYLNPDDFSETDKKLLASELATVEASKKAYAAQQAQIKKQQKADAAKARKTKAEQTKAQVQVVKEMIEKYQEMSCFAMITDLEKKFKVEKNRNMGLRGRVNSLTRLVNQTYPLASNRRALIALLNNKRNAVEKDRRAAIAAKKEAEAAKQADGDSGKQAEPEASEQ